MFKWIKKKILKSIVKDIAKEIPEMKEKALVLIEEHKDEIIAKIKDAIFKVIVDIYNSKTRDNS